MDNDDAKDGLFGASEAVMTIAVALVIEAWGQRAKGSEKERVKLVMDM
jgi:hypothetical protein